MKKKEFVQPSIEVVTVLNANQIFLAHSVRTSGLDEEDEELEIENEKSSIWEKSW